jgi:hypothetical protein
MTCSTPVIMPARHDIPPRQARPHKKLPTRHGNSAPCDHYEAVPLTTGHHHGNNSNPEYIAEGLLERVVERGPVYRGVDE